MIRRPLIGLAAAVALLIAGATGTVQPVKAAGPVDHLSFSPHFGSGGPNNPGLLAPSGSLGVGASVAVTLTALSAGVAVPNESINLEFNHEDPNTSGGSAIVSGTPLGATATALLTDGSGHITITYTAPSSPLPNGRDVIYAQDVAVPTVTNDIAYDSSIVASYTFTPSPIAAAASLTPGTQVQMTVTANDSSSHPVPGADILLSTSTTAASGGGSATATSAVGGTRAITSTFTRFTANASGQVPITYTAGSNISGGVDTVAAFDHTGDPKFGATDSYTAPATPAATFHAVTPFRLADTRSNSGQPLAGQHLGASQVDTVPVIGRDGVPVGATAAVLNVTVTNPTIASFLTVYPGPSLPLASNLNFVAGQTVANLVTVPIAPGGGGVNLYNLAGTTDAVVDLEGYFFPTAGPVGLYNPLSPARIADTRAGSGQPNAGQTLSSGSVLRVQVDGVGGVPASNVSAVVLNVTATGPTGSSFLTAYPDGAARPLASNLNFTAGQVVPNRVIVPVGSTGAIDVYNLNGQVDVVVDVGGWFTASVAGGTGKLFTPINPTRVADTRPGSGQPLAGKTLGQGFTDAVSMSPAGPPVGAVAVAANVTVVNGTASSYLTAFPGGTGRPLASDLNWVHNQVVPNLVVTTLGSGVLDLYNNAGSVDAIVDVFGFWS